jgi:hypothetical protein
MALYEAEAFGCSRVILRYFLPILIVVLNNKVTGRLGVGIANPLSGG